MAYGAIGGTVFRRALSEVKEQVHEENVAAMKADLAHLNAEHAKASADRKEKIQEKITNSIRRSKLNYKTQKQTPSIATEGTGQSAGAQSRRT